MPAAASPAAQSAVPPHQHPRATAAQGTAAPQLYQGRHPEQSLLYRTIAAHFETWLGAGQFRSIRRAGRLAHTTGLRRTSLPQIPGVEVVIDTVKKTSLRSNFTANLLFYKYEYFHLTVQVVYLNQALGRCTSVDRPWLVHL